MNDNPIDIFFNEVTEFILENSIVKLSTFAEIDLTDPKTGIMCCGVYPRAFRVADYDLSRMYTSSKLFKIFGEPCEAVHRNWFDFFRIVCNELMKPNVNIYNLYHNETYVKDKISQIKMIVALE